MIGAYKVKVRNSRNRYEFEIKRNITILCGDSGTGKTTLYDMLEEYNRFGKSSGVTVSCDKRIVTLSEAYWEMELDNIRDAIIVIDEGQSFIRSYDFAKKVRGADNYFLLITRDYLPHLPYSVDEIYTLSGTKNKKFVHAFEETERMFSRATMGRLPFRPEVIITEDSGSGYQFFSRLADELGLICESAKGKTRIYEMLCKYADRKTVVIADGAAFGSEIARVVGQQMFTLNEIAIFLPESFEWLIMKSGLVKGAKEKTERPELRADSKKYMSWEQYFTEVLTEMTKESRFQKYSKGKLNEYYLQEHSVLAMKENMKGLDLT